MCCDVRFLVAMRSKADLSAGIQANIRTDHEVASCRSRIAGIEWNYHPLETARTGGFSREDYFMKIEIEYCGR
jgi:hypothetical protein